MVGAASNSVLCLGRNAGLACCTNPVVVAAKKKRIAILLVNLVMVFLV
jgi:hypothetical protein